ncbi:hypothetical protein [Mycobacterium sp.]|uniref:hypothetical protein n=1 Tax=Mycobacterium sp. TaxID=1785 RepID=UPI002B6D0992|nr:hypothetical protein [Mycobacterium sp.]HKP41174.1 hypothetical protein [Mycobacterium sp.]
MSGDYTSVPLRPNGPRWLATKMQQGRVLLDGDWNLNIDAVERERENLAATIIGEAGVAEGSTAFEITFAADGSMHIGAGPMWIGGLCAVNPADLAYTAQESIPPLPPDGTALVYLDAVVQEIQPAEDPTELIDPALDGVDTTTRTRVAWRVRVASSAATTCSGASAALPQTLSTGRLDVVRTAPALTADPCAPPDDPRGKLPDGLLRVEVLDSGTESSARFAWSYENGSAAVAAAVAGTTATLVPSPSITFVPNDLVEVSTLIRRLDRKDNGPLLTATAVAPGAGGAVVTLSAPAPVAGNPSGLCLRRWDGQVVGAAGQVPATWRGTDVGVAFTARPGDYLAGDWWAVRVRGSAADAVETLTDSAPDGTEHHVTPLAVVDLAAKTVLSDCRPTFNPLTDAQTCTCTVTAFPGDDLQAAADRLPETGGELCLAAGTYALDTPVTITRKSRIVVTGVGPATVVHIHGHESVFQFTDCTDVTVEHLRAEAGIGADVAGRIGEPQLFGALTFLGCTDVRVRDCELICPDNKRRAQSALYSAPSAKRANSRNRITDNRLQIGDQQIGVLIISSDETTVAGNDIRIGAAPVRATEVLLPLLARQLARYIGSKVQMPPAGTAPGAAPAEQPPAPAKAAPAKAAPAKAAPAKSAAKGAAAKEVAAKAIPAEATPTTTTPAAAVGAHIPAGRLVQLANGANFALAGPPQIQHIADQFSTLTEVKALSRLTPRQGLERFVRRAVQAPQSLALSMANSRFFSGISTRSRSMAQGIVVAGDSADLVGIHDNLIGGVIEGIHVGLGSADGGTATAGDVTISRNVVACVIPFYWNRSRHAIYVGSVDRLTIHDNSASLVRSGGIDTDVAAFPATPVEAVRIYGRIGPWLSVRGLSLTGPFHCGVRVTQTATTSIKRQLRYVSDVLNSTGTGPALLPYPFPYPHDRCVP